MLDPIKGAKIGLLTHFQKLSRIPKKTPESGNSKWRTFNTKQKKIRKTKLISDRKTTFIGSNKISDGKSCIKVYLNPIVRLTNYRYNA